MYLNKWICIVIREVVKLGYSHGRYLLIIEVMSFSIWVF